MIQERHCIASKSSRSTWRVELLPQLKNNLAEAEPVARLPRDVRCSQEKTATAQSQTKMIETDQDAGDTTLSIVGRVVIAAMS